MNRRFEVSLSREAGRRGYAFRPGFRRPHRRRGPTLAFRPARRAAPGDRRTRSPSLPRGPDRQSRRSNRPIRRLPNRPPAFRRHKCRRDALLSNPVPEFPNCASWRAPTSLIASGGDQVLVGRAGRTVDHGRECLSDASQRARQAGRLGARGAEPRVGQSVEPLPRNFLAAFLAASESAPHRFGAGPSRASPTRYSRSPSAWR